MIKRDGVEMDWESTKGEIYSEKDYLDEDIERIVQEPKVAVEIIPRRRRQSVPNEFVLRVRLARGHSRGLKVLARKAGGQWFISLTTERGDIIRRYDYQYRGHPNPNGTMTGKSHKHIPTERYPLIEGHKKINTWAYDPETYPDEFEEAVKCFCVENNIDLVAIQQRLNWG